MKRSLTILYVHLGGAPASASYDHTASANNWPSGLRPATIFNASDKDYPTSQHINT